jgi:hypothetical protein
MSDGTLIATVRKNQNEEVRVSLSTFKGCDLCDVRVYASFDDGDAERRPTKKGIAVKVDRLPELIAALQSAEAEARRRGLFEARRAA